MNLFKYRTGVYILVLLLTFSCKTSQTAKSDEVDEEPQIIRSSDIILVDKELKDTLEGYFRLFSKMDLNDTGNRDAKMEEVFEYFSSPDTPVFFALYNNKGEKYYDKPVTISNYLYYLYDTRQAPHVIQAVKLDESQKKITQIELAIK
ncbi:hypothetical protein JMN32_02575 [Fulvivirga sp. 29W222]|uniref:Lipoprotein n=1 Tax=Fulvivirga marina TaxID=2494733 RepID=A0A937KCN9_9BACT|nr:hypothetical protein [Fulvivirga marina]MBL6445175.1 hypothetical protein [Fulvivirga marina]